MDESEYKRRCAQPDVMKRADLHASEARLRKTVPALADLLIRVMAGQPVPKPSLHQGARDDDCLYLTLTPDEIEAIHDALRDEEVSYAIQETMLGDSSAGYVGRIADLWLKAESVRLRAS